MIHTLIFHPGEDSPQNFECPEPVCTETERAYPTPTPQCPMHGLPMKAVRK